MGWRVRGKNATESEKKKRDRGGVLPRVHKSPETAEISIFLNRWVRTGSPCELYCFSLIHCFQQIANLSFNVFFTFNENDMCNVFFRPFFFLYAKTNH